MRFAWQFSVPPGKYRNRSSYHAMKVSFQVPSDLIFAWSGERWLDEAHEGWHSTRKSPITLSSLKRPISSVIKARSRCITNKTDKYYLNRSSEASDRRTTSYGTLRLIHTCRAVPLPSTESAVSFVKVRVVVVRNRTWQTNHGPSLNSQIPCRALAVHLPRTFKVACTAAWSKHGRGKTWYVWIKHGRTVLFSWERHKLTI